MTERCSSSRYPEDDDPEMQQRIADHTESMSLESLILVVSERVTQLSFGWADGVCRAELKSGQTAYCAWGPKASVALARAMLLFDRETRTRNTVADEASRKSP